MQVVTIRMPKVLHERLKGLAREKGLTLNALIINLLWNNVESEVT